MTVAESRLKVKFTEIVVIKWEEVVLFTLIVNHRSKLITRSVSVGIFVSQRSL